MTRAPTCSSGRGRVTATGRVRRRRHGAGYRTGYQPDDGTPGVRHLGGSPARRSAPADPAPVRPDRPGVAGPPRRPDRRTRRVTSTCLREVSRLSAEGVNLAGIQRILELEAEVDALHRNLSRLQEELAAPGRPRHSSCGGRADGPDHRRRPTARPRRSRSEEQRHGRLQLTTKSQEAIAGAVRRAAADGHSQVEPRHLLSTLLAQADGIAAAVLDAAASSAARSPARSRPG